MLANEKSFMNMLCSKSGVFYTYNSVLWLIKSRKVVKMCSIVNMLEKNQSKNKKMVFFVDSVLLP